MKKYLNIILPVTLLFSFAGVQAQKKKVTAKRSNNTIIIKATSRNFGSPSSITQITDVTEPDPAYESVRNLIENYGVTLAYDDNTFKGKETLKRGDFIVALNSALVSLKNRMDAAGLDTSLFNTYDRNRGGAYLTSINQIKDVTEGNVYYPAAKSLIERWGIGEPFSLAKTLDANSPVPEKEVYDILRVVLGYNSAGVNPYASMSRNKFAIVLNNAITQKLTEINTLASIQQAKRDADRRRQLDSLQRADALRKDSVAKEIEARRQEAARKEEEARKQLQKKKN